MIVCDLQIIMLIILNIILTTTWKCKIQVAVLFQVIIPNIIIDSYYYYYYYSYGAKMFNPKEPTSGYDS